MRHDRPTCGLSGKRQSVTKLHNEFVIKLTMCHGLITLLRSLGTDMEGKNVYRFTFAREVYVNLQFFSSRVRSQAAYCTPSSSLYIVAANFVDLCRRAVCAKTRRRMNAALYESRRADIIVITL